MVIKHSLAKIYEKLKYAFSSLTQGLKEHNGTDINYERIFSEEYVYLRSPN